MFCNKFWNHVEVRSENECWLWNGPKNKGGYGYVGAFKKRKILAHRVSWFIHNGAIPDELFVLHDCPDGDLPCCVNPKHLWLGTSQDNKRDSVLKGRAFIFLSEASPTAKLTRESVKQIRNIYASGTSSQMEIAELFGVNQSQVSRVISRETWKHI